MKWSQKSIQKYWWMNGMTFFFSMAILCCITNHFLSGSSHCNYYQLWNSSHIPTNYHQLIYYHCHLSLFCMCAGETVDCVIEYAHISKPRYLLAIEFILATKGIILKHSLHTNTPIERKTINNHLNAEIMSSKHVRSMISAFAFIIATSTSIFLRIKKTRWEFVWSDHIGRKIDKLWIPINSNRKSLQNLYLDNKKGMIK